MKNTIDDEIKSLCKALNMVEGIETLSSCCGHGKEPIYIWFRVDSILHLNKVMWAGCHRYWNWEPNWLVNVDPSDPNRDRDALDLCLVSVSTGNKAYTESKELAVSIVKWVKSCACSSAG